MRVEFLAIAESDNVIERGLLDRLRQPQLCRGDRVPKYGLLLKAAGFGPDIRHKSGADPTLGHHVDAMPGPTTIYVGEVVGRQRTGP